MVRLIQDNPVTRWPFDQVVKRVDYDGTEIQVGIGQLRVDDLFFAVSGSEASPASCPVYRVVTTPKHLLGTASQSVGAISGSCWEMTAEQVSGITAYS